MTSAICVHFFVRRIKKKKKSMVLRCGAHILHVGLMLSLSDQDPSCNATGSGDLVYEAMCCRRTKVERGGEGPQ